MVSLKTALVAMSLCGTGDTMLLDFYADWCGPCRQMDPVVQQLKARYPVQKVNIDQHPDLARRFAVSRIPCFIMLVDGKPVSRVIGPRSFEELERICQAGLAASSSARQDSPPPTRPQVSEEHRQVTSGPEPPAPGQAPHPRPTPPTRPAVRSSAAAGADGPPVTDEQLLAATVRLRVEDPNGYSWGTGTIIDARQGKALILTCAHIFRDSNGQGSINVELFGPQAAGSLVGTLVSWDLKRDVALVAISPTESVTAARVAPPGYEIQKGQAVASAGCNGGADPTVRHSRVTAINRFLGPHNILVAGQSVRGRSGGGLFTPSGLVIGVCHGANPSDNEAMFMALDEVQSQLDQARLSYVYREDVREPGGESAVAGHPLPAMPPAMPGPSRHGRLVPVPPRSEGTPEQAAGGPLSPEERAAISEIRRMAEGAEVICIVRSLTDPQAKSQIIVLDKASPAFLDQLASEARVQDERHLTGAVKRDPTVAAATGSNTPDNQPDSNTPILLPRKHPQIADSPERYAGWDPRWLTRVR